MSFKNKLKAKANKSFDKLIVDPSFISQKLVNKPVTPRNNKKLFVPIFSASLALALVGVITVSAIVRNNIAINNENARIRDDELNYIKPFEGKYYAGGTSNWDKNLEKFLVENKIDNLPDAKHLSE